MSAKIVDVTTETRDAEVVRSAAGVLTGAWGGDPARKQSSIAAARMALATAPAVDATPLVRMAADCDPLGNVYCVAFGTAEKNEIEARANLPTSTLMLASSALCGSHYQRFTEDHGQLSPQLVDGAVEAAVAALEAIRVGADPLELARCYVADLLSWVVDLHDRDDRGLTPEHQSLVRQLTSAHEEVSADPARFRSLRRAMIAAADQVVSDIEKAVLQFAESVAWPLPGLSVDMPGHVARLHSSLRVLLTLEPPSPADREVQDAFSILQQNASARYDADPSFDVVTFIRSSPELAAVRDPAYCKRRENRDRAAAEAYTPLAADLLIGAFRKA